MGKVMHVLFLHKQKVVVWWWNRGGSVNTKETMYVVSVDVFNAEGSVFSCELSEIGEGV